MLVKPTDETMAPVRLHWQAHTPAEFFPAFPANFDAADFTKAIDVRERFARLFLGEYPYFERPESPEPVQQLAVTWAETLAQYAVASLPPLLHPANY